MRHKSGVVRESLEVLQEWERRYRHRPQELRMKALCLLKEHPEWTFKHVAQLLGRSEGRLSQ